MNNPLISVIIPTYNRALLIGETLDSVLAQTYENWECIVVDDGSTDNTDEMVNKYLKKDSRFQYHHRPDDRLKGANACRNYGVELCKGEYLIFLDSDDKLINYCLKNRVEGIRQFPNNLFWIYPMFVEIENDKRIPKVITHEENYLVEFLSYRLQWGIMCTFWKISFFKILKGFNENYPRLNDPEMHIRAMINAKNKFKVFNDAKPDSIYRPNLLFDNTEFAKKYYESLNKFVSDISKILQESKNKEYLKYLKNYLFHYMSVYEQYVARKANIKLIKRFRHSKVLSRSEYLYLLFLYLILIISDYVKKKSEKNILRNLKT